MKARKLRKLLNDTKYTVSNNPGYIAVGSNMCHDLISVDKKTFKIKYAIDPFGRGRNELEGKEELLFIWDKLSDLIKSGEINDIINGVDEIENPLVVWTFVDDQIIQTFTEEYGWPNVTIDGYIMYENTHFKTKKEAIDQAIKERKAAVSSYQDMVNSFQSKLDNYKQKLAAQRRYLKNLNALNPEQNS